MIPGAFSKTDQRIFRALKIILGLCLAVPLFVWPSLIFPFSASKGFIFRILVELAAIGYFYLTVKHRALRPKKTALLVAVLFFLLTWFLSALAGVDLAVSFWGSMERMLGVWGLAHFILFFLIAGVVFQAGQNWKRYFKISVGVSSLVALLALFQGFTDLSVLSPQVERVYGTLGNAAFLAGYLVFNIFLAIYLFLTGSKKAGEKFFYGLAVFLLVIVLFLTGTRGAVLGLATGVILALILFGIFWPQRKARRYFLAGVVAVLFFGSLLFAVRNTEIVQNNVALQRLTSISFESATVQNRLILWRSAWPAWQERPVFGWGGENFEVAVNRYFDPRLNPYEAVYDRAHNFIFDYGVAGGWLGLLSYLSLLAIAVFYLFKIARKNKENLFLAVLMGSLIAAYLVQNFFVFDTVVSFLMLFFILAAINFLYSQNNLPPNQPAKKIVVFGAAKKIFVIFLAALALISVYYLNVKPILSARLANQVLALEAANAQRAFLLLEKSLALNTFANREIIYQVSLDYLDKIGREPILTQDENFYKLTAVELARTVEHSPAQLKNYVALAWLDLYFSGADASRINSAIELAQRARQLAPAKRDPCLVLVAAYAVGGETEKALMLIDEVRKIDAALGDETERYWRQISNN